MYHKKIQNDLKIPNSLNSLLSQRTDLKVTKPNLAITPKKGRKINFKNDFILLNSRSFYKRMPNKKKLKIYDFYLEQIEKIKRKYKLICRNNKTQKIFIAKKVFLACGTIATTKLLMNYLNIISEIRIRHHLRLISAF